MIADLLSGGEGSALIDSVHPKGKQHFVFTFGCKCKKEHWVAGNGFDPDDYFCETHSVGVKKIVATQLYEHKKPKQKGKKKP